MNHEKGEVRSTRMKWGMNHASGGKDRLEGMDCEPRKEEGIRRMERISYRMKIDKALVCGTIKAINELVSVLDQYYAPMSGLVKTEVATETLEAIQGAVNKTQSLRAALEEAWDEREG